MVLTPTLQGAEVFLIPDLTRLALQCSISEIRLDWCSHVAPALGRRVRGSGPSKPGRVIQGHAELIFCHFPRAIVLSLRLPSGPPLRSPAARGAPS